MRFYVFVTTQMEEGRLPASPPLGTRLGSSLYRRQHRFRYSAGRSHSLSAFYAFHLVHPLVSAIQKVLGSVSILREKRAAVAES